MIRYAVDTNVFIEAKNRYYPFDMPPGRWFWGLMDRAASAGVICSAARMREELLPASDQLTAWARSHGDSLWIPPDTSVIDNVRKLVTWAQGRVGATSRDLLQPAVDEFARGDVFLIATAAAKDLVVVTHEQSSPAARKRIMIPDACRYADVACVDPWVMLKDLDDRLGE